MKEEILNEYNGKYCSIDELVTFSKGLNKETARKTVIWNVNDLVRQGKAVRFGRGVYGFMRMARFHYVVSETVKRACCLLQEKYKYLVVTVTDSLVLGQFMNLQPFSSIVIMETKKSATSAVVSTLRKEGVDAYAKKDYPLLEQYISSPQHFVVRPELAVNPKLTQEGNMRIANLEKLLVDLICDEDIFGQYQGKELKNIYQNVTENFVVNFSQMIKYASTRKKKVAVLEMLQETDVYRKIRTLL